MTSSRIPYTRAGAVTVTRPDGTVGSQPPYSASEYSSIVSNRKSRKVARIKRSKLDKATRLYLQMVNADN